MINYLALFYNTRVAGPDPQHGRRRPGPGREGREDNDDDERRAK